MTYPFWPLKNSVGKHTISPTQFYGFLFAPGNRGICQPLVSRFSTFARWRRRWKRPWMWTANFFRRKMSIPVVDPVVGETSPISLVWPLVIFKSLAMESGELFKMLKQGEFPKLCEIKLSITTGSSWSFWHFLSAGETRWNSNISCYLVLRITWNCLAIETPVSSRRCFCWGEKTICFTVRIFRSRVAGW